MRKPALVLLKDLRDRIRPVFVRPPIRERGARHLFSQLSSECEPLGARDGSDPDRLIGAAIVTGYYRMD